MVQFGPFYFLKPMAQSKFEFTPHEIALSALSNRRKTFSFPKIAIKWYRLGPAGLPQIASRVGCTSTPVFTPSS